MPIIYVKELMRGDGGLSARVTGGLLLRGGLCLDKSGGVDSLE